MSASSSDAILNCDVRRHIPQWGAHVETQRSDRIGVIAPVEGLALHLDQKILTERIAAGHISPCFDDCAVRTK